MVGAVLGAGAAAGTRADAGRLVFRVDAAMALLSLLLVPVIIFLVETEITWVRSASPAVIFPILTGAVGFLVGAQFPLAAKLMFEGVERTTGALFAFDLIGASLGALLVGTFLIPLLGVVGTCCFLGVLKIGTAAGLRSEHEVRVLHPQRQPTLASTLSFGLMLLTLVGMGAAIMAEQTSSAAYAVSLSPFYYWMLVVLMAVGIVRAIDPQRFEMTGGNLGDRMRAAGRAVRRISHVQLFRWVQFFAFSLAVFYPIFRCYFRVPYLFCHVCPRKCIFGLVRPYLVPAALIMNLERRLWCYQACPIGTLADSQARLAKTSQPAPRTLRVLSIVVLVFTGVSYFKMMWDLQAQPITGYDWYNFFYRNAFEVSAAVVIIAAVLILATARLKRLFCAGLCPIGAFSDLVQRGERKLLLESVVAPKSDEARG